jgi:patatin-related protein
MLPGVTAAVDASDKRDDIDAKSREVRLGLVMYGGISLAIYISGVAQEFARVVRGQGIYRLVKALTDSDVVVDIISGTSAGGINGIALGYALCNERDLAPVFELWRKRADILPLLQSPFQATPPIRSILNSEGYYQSSLFEAFENMCQHPQQREDGDDPSPFSELDLFITGTNMAGTHYTQFDDAGHPVDVKDHRQVFWLKHRLQRKEPFNPTFDQSNGRQATHGALATLARITSAFPAAFTPVHVDKASSEDDSVDGKLHQWGQLGSDKDAYFLDGGVLDNHPFTYTIEAIFSRSADREVVRKLLYVEPDPAEVRPQAAPTEPNFLETILAALVGIPDYQSIANDLKLLATHNSKLKQYNRLVADLEVRASNNRIAGETLAGDRVLSEEARLLYRRSRLGAISDRVIEGVLKKDGKRVAITSSDERQKAAELTEFFDEWLQNQPAEQTKILDDFDVYFRLRRVERLVYLLYDLLYSEKYASTVPVGVGNRYLAALRALDRQIEAYEITRSAIEGLIDDLPIAWQQLSLEEIWGQVREALDRLLNRQTLPGQLLGDEYVAALCANNQMEVTRQLAAYRGALKAAADQIAHPIGSSGLPAAATAPGESLLHLLDGAESKLLDQLLPEQDSVVRPTYEEFITLDAVLYPLELVGGLREKDVIETIRISPRDAQRGFSQLGASDKVAGKALYHFGSFFKRSWRANDILWGQLDGICELSESLLTVERVKQIVGDDRWRARVRLRFFEGDAGREQPPTFRKRLDPAMLFPHAGGASQTACRQWLANLLSDDPQLRATALAADTFTTMVELFIESEQLEVICRGLPTVIGDAIDEQAAWNRFQVGTQTDQSSKSSAGAPPTTGPLPWVFTPIGRGTLDPFVAIVASAQRVRAAMDWFSSDDGNAPNPGSTKLGQFFKAHYQVGSEKILSDIPLPVLLQILALSLFALRNCILGVLDAPTRQAVQRNLLYVFVLDLPLRAFYAMAILWQRAPRTGLAAFVGLALISVLLLAVGVNWFTEIILVSGHLYVTWLLVFIVIPLLILSAEMAFLLLSGRFIRPRMGIATPKPAQPTGSNL